MPPFPKRFSYAAGRAARPHVAHDAVPGGRPVALVTAITGVLALGAKDFFNNSSSSGKPGG